MPTKQTDRMKADRIQARTTPDDLWDLVLEAVDAMLKATQKLIDAAVASRAASLGGKPRRGQ